MSGREGYRWNMHEKSQFINSVTFSSTLLTDLFCRTAILRQCSWVWSRSSLQELLRSSWTKLDGKSFSSSRVSLVNPCLCFCALSPCTVRAWRCYSFPNKGSAMTISTAAFGVYFYIVSVFHSSSATEARPDLTWLALSSMAVFIAGIWIQTHSIYTSGSCLSTQSLCSGFALGWGPIPWLVMGEIFPVKARGFASAVCVLTNWGMAFVVTKTFQNMMVSILVTLKQGFDIFLSHSCP